jgi:hypothetical protein
MPTYPAYLPSSGPISINDINTIFARGNNLNAYRGTTYNTASAGPFTFSSGAISINSFYGTGPTRANINYTFSANTANASIDVTSLSGYLAGYSDITITINSGVYIYSTSTSNAALTLTGGTTGDTIKIVNNGYIMGQGGSGGDVDGRAPSGTAGTDGYNGGNAISLGFATTIDNTNSSAYIGGGGGGGGASHGENSGGGGAGGGPSGIAIDINGVSFQSSGGAVGASGANGSSSPNNISVGGGGGRIFPGIGGAAVTANSPAGTYFIFVSGNGGGAGGSGAAAASGISSNVVCSSGNGGSANYAATDASYNDSSQIAGGSGGGGGWGAIGGASATAAFDYIYPTHIGGSGGKAVSLNGYSVTWVSGNTTRVYGAVS